MLDALPSLYPTNHLAHIARLPLLFSSASTCTPNISISLVSLPPLLHSLRPLNLSRLFFDGGQRILQYTSQQLKNDPIPRPHHREFFQFIEQHHRGRVNALFVRLVRLLSSSIFYLLSTVPCVAVYAHILYPICSSGISHVRIRRSSQLPSQFSPIPSFQLDSPGQSHPWLLCPYQSSFSSSNTLSLCPSPSYILVTQTLSHLLRRYSFRLFYRSLFHFLTHISCFYFPDPPLVDPASTHFRKSPGPKISSPPPPHPLSPSSPWPTHSLQFYNNDILALQASHAVSPLVLPFALGTARYTCRTGPPADHVC